MANGVMETSGFLLYPLIENQTNEMANEAVNIANAVKRQVPIQLLQ